MATTRLFIGGVDLLVLEQRAVLADGHPRPGGPKQFNPASPVELLPPDSPALLPTAAGATVMVGVCSCWEPGCSSLWLRVTRDRDTVVWAPDPDTHYDTVARTWRFDLLPYLDALDTAAAAATALQEPAQRLARELRRRRDSPNGLFFTRPGTYLIDAHAWPGVPEVRLSLATDTGLQQEAVAVLDGESVDDFCTRVCEPDAPDPPQPPAAGDTWRPQP
jgi:hypothetical protein